MNYSIDVFLEKRKLVNDAEIETETAVELNKTKINKI